MKKHPSRFCLLLMLAGSLLGISQVSYGVGGTVFWHNLSDGPNGKSPGVINDVIDCNIDIIGTNALVEGIHVVAQTQDILITVTNEDSVITGSGNRCDLVPTNSARLYLFANEGRTITFQLTWDLLFRGTSDQGAPLDLLVSVSGGGVVQFCIEGGNEVCFTSIPTSGGAQVFVGMDAPNNDPKLLFKRLDPIAGNINQNIEVTIGKDSCITYIAETTVASGNADELGCISYDGANKGTGCNILRVEDCSCFIIFGHWLEVSLNSDFLLDDINLAVPAGLEASFVIENSLGADCPSSVRVINENTKCPNLIIDPFCDNAFTGTQYGFILGANGLLQTNNCTYLDYIGTVTNSVPHVTTPFDNLNKEVQDKIECGELTGPQDLIKFRNCSAFFVDGNPNANAVDAQIHLEGTSAIYFRSGVDCEGDVSPDFTIDPGKEEPGAGNIVFDVEGELLVRGEPGQNSALNVLSLQVNKTGCPIFVEVDEKPIFPERTFNRDADGAYLQYNKGAFLINNIMEMRYTSLLHTDEIHEVFQNNNLGRSDLSSEPTYIGGETFKLCARQLVCPGGLTQRPTIRFNDSIFRVQTSVGLTGVDVCISNDDENENGNQSIFRFYNNGRAIDNAYGRVYIAGTNVGSLSACGFLIDNNSHIDVFQKTPSPFEEPNPHSLTLEVGFNDECITEGIQGDISGQCAVHEIFLNNASNISIGSDGELGINLENCEPFELQTTPSLCIAGEFYSFNTAGGLWGLPQESGTTGQGGIFVDQNGTIKSQCRASFSTMVTRSRNGIVDLPKNQVFFSNRVGITVWQPNLTDSDERVLVPQGACFSDFSMDWGALRKDYTTSNSFVPYELKCTPNPCDCPPVLHENLRALPLVKGNVEQFQILRSRIGDQANLQVSCGAIIKELIWLLGCNPAEAATGFLVVQDEATVGLGTAHRNKDSNCANVVLGVNGLTICANGDATIELNEDVIVNNVCHIVTGTSFGTDANNPGTLRIYSADRKELRIKSTGVLDLSQFNSDLKTLQFAGQVVLIFEPGSRLILGGGNLVFTDESQLAFERVLNDDLLLFTSEPSDLDPVRVKISGTGFVLFDEDAVCEVLQNAFVGVEAFPQCDLNTSVTIELRNQARFSIGTDSRPGGSLQVGNTACIDESNVDLTIVLNGVGALWEINRQGFMGLGVGIANKASQIPNDWLVNCLENLFGVFFDIQQGTLTHDQIRSGNISTAALLAVGPAEQYSFIFNLVQSVIRGGGNVVQLLNCPECNDQLKDVDFARLKPEQRKAALEAKAMMERADELMKQAKEMMKTAAITRGPAKDAKFASAREMIDQCCVIKRRAQTLVRNVINPSVNPIVLDTAGIVANNPSIEVGIMAGKMPLRDKGEAAAQPISVSPQAFFNYITMIPFDLQSSPRANIFRDQIELSTLGFLDDVAGTLQPNPTIRREDVQFILGTNGFNDVDHDHSLRIGGVAINLNTVSRDLNGIRELRGSNGF